MKVSVILLIHDENIEHLKKCINSLIYQSYKNLEIVVVDDSNNLQNESLINNLKHKILIKYIKLTKQISLPDARNLGIKNSSNDIIFLQDSDDWSNKDRIQNQIHYLNNGIDICCGLTSYYTSNETLIFSAKQSQEIKRVNYKEILKNNHVAIGSVAFKKKIFINEDYLFRNEIKYCDDMDFVLRYSQKFNFSQINKLIYNYRFNKNSSTLNTPNDLQPYLDYATLVSMYKENNFKIDEIRNKISKKHHSKILNKNMRTKISYSVYSGEFIGSFFRSKNSRQKFYSALLTIKVIFMILVNKIKII